MAVGKRTNESTHVEETRITKQQRLAPSLVDTVTDNQLDRSFTAESFTGTESQIGVGDARRGFMLNTSLPSLLDLNFTQTSHSDTSMSSTVDFNFTQISQCTSTPSLDLPNGAPTDSALGSDLTSERGSNTDNLVHDSRRWNEGAVSNEEGKFVLRNKPGQENWSFRFATRPDINQPALSQKKARNLKLDLRR